MILHRQYVVLAAVVTGGCHHPPVEAPLWVPRTGASTTPPQPSFEGFSAANQADLMEAIQITGNLVASQAFRGRFASINNLNAGPRGPTMASEKVLDAYATRAPVHYIQDDKCGETADTETYGDYAIMKFGASNFDRWNKGKSPKDILRRACFINTLAHEWTHAVPNHDDPKGHTLFTDDGHSDSRVPVVSYSIGAIAQCEYLVDNAVISDDKFWSCVHGVGTRDFYGLTVCENDEWLARLTSGVSP